MKKTYLKLLTLAMMLVAATTASAQYSIDLEDGMFKPWSSPDPGASEVAPEEAIAEDGTFGFENNMYKNVGGGTVIYGHTYVYYLWYADLTGTQTIDFAATPGMQLRVLLNRPAPEEGGDSHGGTTVERNFTVPENGTYTLDVSDLEYVHLNCIKTGWGSPADCKVTSIKLNGSLQGSGEKHEPMDLISAGFQSDVVRVSLSDMTNLAALNKASERVIFPNDCVTVKVNGAPATVLSVEGMNGNSLFIFLNDGYPDSDADEVLVTFNNPADPHLTFVEGRFEGQDVPSFTDLKAAYTDGLGENYSYLAATPELVSAEPEDGSFNLPTSTNTFKLTFTANVNCDEVKATLGGQALTVAPATGFSKELTLTYGGGSLNGVQELVVTNIKPEMDFLDNAGEVTLTYSFGPVVIDPDDQTEDIITADAFNNCASGKIPEGFIVNFNGEERNAKGSYGSGPRMFEFAAGGDFTKGLYFREGYCETADALELEEGKTYTITFNSASWKGNTTMKFEIYDESEIAVYSQDVKNEPNMEGKTDAVKGATFTTVKFTPEYGGYYRLRWTAEGFTEVLLANVTMKYISNTMGVSWMTLVQDAIDAANKTLTDVSGERYLGTATDNLTSLVSQYSDMSQYTNPSGCQAAADALNAAIQAVKDHCAACDNYDSIVKKAIDVVRQNEMPEGDPKKATKYVTTELFAQLKSTVAKYNGTSQWQNIGDEEAPQWQLNYEFDVLKDDTQLTSAIEELTGVTNLAVAMFTTGPSKCNMTGYAVITERLRLGVETLKALGVPERGYLAKKALASLTDDDNIAAELKDKIMRRLYNTLSDPDNTLFEEKEDEATQEKYVDPVDMTVFVKNPNIYRTSASFDITEENIPGWTTPEGNAKPGYTTGWSTVGGDGIPADGMFSNWGGSSRVEQTITDLPAGVYTIKFAFGERMDEASNEGSYYYINTTVGEEQQGVPAVIGQSYPVCSNTQSLFENVVITDGKLTLGVNAGEKSHFFFNEVQLLMTAPAPGFSYPKMEEGPDVLPGDVNIDGTVDVADISGIISHMAGTADYAPDADVNGDGTVDVADISNVITIMANNARLAGLPVDEEE